MKTRTILRITTAVLVFTLLTVSCKKDEVIIICYPTTILQTDSGVTSTIIIAYNTSNKVTSITVSSINGTFTQTHTIDSKGNISSAVYTGGSSTSTSTFTYDANNNLTQEDYNSGGTITRYTYQYNSSNQLTSAMSSYTFQERHTQAPHCINIRVHPQRITHPKLMRQAASARLSCTNTTTRTILKSPFFLPFKLTIMLQKGLRPHQALLRLPFIPTSTTIKATLPLVPLRMGR